MRCRLCRRLCQPLVYAGFIYRLIGVPVNMSNTRHRTQHQISSSVQRLQTKRVHQKQLKKQTNNQPHTHYHLILSLCVSVICLCWNIGALLSNHYIIIIIKKKKSVCKHVKRSCASAYLLVFHLNNSFIVIIETKLTKQQREWKSIKISLSCYTR